MKIFLVSTGSYSDYRIVAAYSNKDKAAETVEFLQNIDTDVEITEFELDSFDINFFRDKCRWEVKMDKDGNVLKVTVMNNYSVSNIKNLTEYFEYANFIGGYCFAKSPEAAIKIINEQRGIYIAEGKRRGLGGV